MNLGRSIRRVIKEELTSRENKILRMIDDAGLLHASMVIGGLEKLTNMIGGDKITIKMMIGYIKDVVSFTLHDYITFYEMDEEPIELDKFEDYDDEEIDIRIGILYPDDVMVNYYSGDEEWDEYVGYERLSDEIIIEIYNMVVKYYKKYY